MSSAPTTSAVPAGSPITTGAVEVHPSVLYWGTPVVLLSTLNPDGTTNVAPISSVWWLGWGAMLGLTASSRSLANLLAVGECVVNLPSDRLAAEVDRLARTTGADPVPLDKAWLGFEHVADKFRHAGLTPAASPNVRPHRVAECDVQMQAVVKAIHPFGADNPLVPTDVRAVEVEIVGVHVDAGIVMAGTRDRIDPDRWRPLIMSFRSFYGLAERLPGERLSSAPEERWRPPLLDRLGSPSTRR